MDVLPVKLSAIYSLSIGARHRALCAYSHRWIPHFKNPSACNGKVKLAKSKLPKRSWQ